MSTATGPYAEIVVDLAAIRHNVRLVRERTEVPLMVVVKADGYGHGMIASAEAARQAGATWLGVALLDEALALRAAGDKGRILSWLALPGENYAAALAADVDVTASSVAQLDEIVAAARNAGESAGEPARVQLKVDTGLSRGGATATDWPALVAAARKAETAGEIRVTGIWSHLAASDDQAHPANDAQETAFRLALALAADAGLTPEVRHLANSAAALGRPSARFDMVRCGLSAYGLDPAPGPDGPSAGSAGLRPAMTVRTRLALTKAIPAGAGVSYGHTWIAPAATTVGLVPIGYGEGVPRCASSRAEVFVGGERRPVRGRICMDQFVIDLHGADFAAGESVVVMGPGTDGEPTAQEWADACETISYEIVTRWGGRMHRVYLHRTDVPEDEQ